MDDFKEPSEEEIQEYLDRNNLNRSRNWWHAREALRKAKNGDPPDGYTYWGIYWKTY